MRWWIIVAVGGALLAAACTSDSASGAAQALSAEPDEVKVIVLPFVTHAPFHIAAAEGYFTDQNLDVEFVSAQGGFDSLPALIQGDVDVWAASMTPSVINAIAGGADIKMVADKGYVPDSGCNYFSLVAGSHMGERGDLSELRGARISVGRTLTTDYFFDEILDVAGLTRDDVTIVDGLNTVSTFEALSTGAIDFGMLTEPWVTRHTAAGNGSIWVPAPELVPGYQTAFVLYGSKLLGEDADVGRRFMVAFLEGVRQYNQGATDRNVEIITAATEIDEELLRASCWPPIRNDGQLNLEALGEAIEWGVAHGQIDAVPADDELWDPSFAEQASEFLGAGE